MTRQGAVARSIRLFRVYRVARVVAVGALTAVFAAGAGLALAIFIDTEAPANATFTTARIFPSDQTTAMFDVRDASSGTEIDASSAYAFDDGRTATTKAWSSSFDTSRYVEFNLNAPLPGGLTISGATFDLRFASSAADDTTCFYIELRIASTGAVLATYGSSGSPLGCVTGTTQSTISTAVAAVSSTDVADDLRVRVYGRNSGSSSMVVERATVAGSTPYVSFTLYATSVTDAADASPSTSTWPLHPTE